MAKCIINFFSNGEIPTSEEILKIFPESIVHKSVGFIDIESKDWNRSVLLGTSTRNQITIYVIESENSPWLKKVIKSIDEWVALKEKLNNFLHNGICSDTDFKDWEKN